MVTFPNAKINIGLNVVRKRDDGFHDLETVFYPINFCDVLEIITPEKNFTEIGFSFSSTGIEIPGSSNLCEKAWQLLQKHFPDKINEKQTLMHLHKIIPIGAGLGGGSSDAAFTLKMLNTIFSLGISKNKLIEFASQLGSDCAFFMENSPVIAHGRGNEMQNISLNLDAYFLMLVVPNIHISTALAFSEIKPKEPEKNLEELILSDIHTWKSAIKNDFEVPVFKKFPELKSIKEKLYELGATYASLSGSGSALYGIFSKKPESVIFENCFTKIISLKIGN